MDPFERFLRRPLDEVLVGQGYLTRERADELLEHSKESFESFGMIVLDSGALTAWDLAKTVATHYQMPVQRMSGYRFDKELFVGMAPELLHRHLVVPIGVFGKTRTFAVLEPPSRELIDELTATCGVNIFFFVAEGPEIRRVLHDTVKVVDTTNDTGWQKLFDSAEQEVVKGLVTKKR